jgi:pimeloyl-ACP methyl ester carboxylesterase
MHQPNDVELAMKRLATGVTLYVVGLGEMNVPTLILWGEQDALFPREEQERLAAAIPGATLRVYPETGHAVHWERPEQFARDLEAFMEEIRIA